MNDEHSVWFKVHAFLHPASGSPAVEVWLHIVDGELRIDGFHNRVGRVVFERQHPAANSTPYMAGV